MEHSSSDTAVQRSVRAYARLARTYQRRHPEIFNPVEQQRVRETLAVARDAIRGNSSPLRALDFGCGTGNLTAHLLDLGFDVVAADISTKFLTLIDERFADEDRVTTHRLSGRNLNEFDPGTFDLIATYSVLHHVPDYLHVVEEFGRVLCPGGVVYIDHEASGAAWEPGGGLKVFRDDLATAGFPKPFPKRLFTPAWRVDLTRLVGRIFRRRYEPEGDIHVWPDDHIEWDKIEARLAGGGVDVLERQTYLLYHPSYPRDVWEQHRTRCGDMGYLIARRH